MRIYVYVYTNVYIYICTHTLIHTSVQRSDAGMKLHKVLQLHFNYAHIYIHIQDLIASLHFANKSSSLDELGDAASRVTWVVCLGLKGYTAASPLQRPSDGIFFNSSE